MVAIPKVISCEVDTIGIIKLVCYLEIWMVYEVIFIRSQVTPSPLKLRVTISTYINQTN